MSAILRTLVHDIRIAATWGDLAEVRRLLAQHAKTPAARRDALLAAIEADPSGRWKSGRAVTALHKAGFHPVSAGTASRDLARLAAAGHLIRHTDPDCTWYEAGAQ